MKRKTASPKFREWLRPKGRISDMADHFGITPGAVDQWKKKIPMERIHEVSRLTGISLSDLRPDKVAVLQRKPKDQPKVTEAAE